MAPRNAYAHSSDDPHQFPGVPLPARAESPEGTSPLKIPVVPAAPDRSRRAA